MVSASTFIELRTIMTVLFEDKDLMLLVVDDAGLDSQYIDFDKPPIIRCQNVLREAKKRHKLHALTVAALTHFPAEATPGLKSVSSRIKLQSDLFLLLKNAPLTWDEFLRCADDCLAKETQIPPEVNNLETLLDFLWDLRPQTEKDYIPIQRLVTGITAISPDLSFKTKVTAWLANATKELSWQVPVTLLTLAKADAPEHDVYVLVEIRTDPCKTLYSLIIHLWDQYSPKPPLFCEYEAKLALSEIQQQWDEVFNSPNTMRLLPQDPGKVHLEFIVPNSLLSYGFDRWVLPKRKEYGETYGMRYPVVVRSWERLQQCIGDALLSNDWSRRAKQARQPDCTFDDEPYTEWICEPQQFRCQELYRKWSIKQGLVCLKMTYQPSNKAGQSDNAKIWLDVGVPTAVWLRSTKPSQLAPEKLQEKIIELVGKQTRLHDLPHQFINIRRKAWNQEEELGTHLALLWDDAERKPGLDAVFIAP